MSTANDQPQTSPEELERILDLPLEIHVEIGRKRMRIAELLAAAPGMVLDLDVVAGAPLSIWANGVLFAHGEAVIVGERYGVRITKVMSVADRFRDLGAAARGAA